MINSLGTSEIKRERLREKRAKGEVKVKKGIKEHSANPYSIGVADKVTE